MGGKACNLADFDFMYEPLLVFLEATGSVGSGWDSETVSEAYGFYKQITSSTFIATFQIVLHFFFFFGYISELQGPSLDMTEGYKMVTRVKSILSGARNDEGEYENVHANMLKMAKIASTGSLEVLRLCGRQSQ